MAGKHSRGLFEKRNKNVVINSTTKSNQQKILSLPFKIIISAIALSLCVSLILVSAYFIPGKTHEKILREAAAKFESSASTTEGIQILASYNSDIKGWLKIEGAGINCAVCQSDNDSYYLNHNQNGKKSRYGALFLAANDSFKRNDDKNIVIYGNNMKDGLMFGNLKKYRNLNFYKQNPSLKLFYEGAEESYIIFAVMLISSSADDKNTYNPSKSYFIDQNEFDEWYNETLQRSLINTTVTAEYGDEFLTLVTRAYDFDGARLVLTAKKVTERQLSQTDVTGAKVNPKIKYPKIWYTKRGLQYPY